jgi:hypothetical protein
LLAERIVRTIRYLLILLGVLPKTSQRKLLWQIFSLSRALPQKFDDPLPAMMARLTPDRPYLDLWPNQVTEIDVRRLVDAVAAGHFWSPLGICLRRSLLRYHFLRAMGLPVNIVFGARLKDRQEGGGLGGHAWLTLRGQPYYETPGDYEGFVEMYVYPETTVNNTVSS